MPMRHGVDKSRVPVGGAEQIDVAAELVREITDGIDSGVALA